MGCPVASPLTRDAAASGGHRCHPTGVPRVARSPPSCRALAGRDGPGNRSPFPCVTTSEPSFPRARPPSSRAAPPGRAAVRTPRWRAERRRAGHGRRRPGNVRDGGVRCRPPLRRIARPGRRRRCRRPSRPPRETTRPRASRSCAPGRARPRDGPGPPPPRDRGQLSGRRFRPSRGVPPAPRGVGVGCRPGRRQGFSPGSGRGVRVRGTVRSPAMTEPEQFTAGGRPGGGPAPGRPRGGPAGRPRW